MIPLRGLLVPLLAGLILIAIGCHARAADKPQIDCALVRQYVAEHGKARALAWALPALIGQDRGGAGKGIQWVGLAKRPLLSQRQAYSSCCGSPRLPHRCLPQ